MTNTPPTKKPLMRMTNVQLAILETIKVTGFISIALLAPNALQALKIFDKDLQKKKRHSINVSRQRMINRGLIRYTNGYLELTTKGQKILKEVEEKNYSIPIPKRWDKKWRILIFDIPVYRNRVRDKLRHVLKQVGFVKLQGSVWVYPYECEDFITLLKTDFKLGKHMLYIVADQIENNGQIKRHFELA